MPMNDPMEGSDQSDFKFLAENSADVICRVTPDYRMVYVSPASVTVLGWTPEEVRAMPPFALVLPEDAPAIRAAIEGGREEGSHIPCAGRVRKKDGTIVWIEATGRHRRDPMTGELTETVVVLRDVTARKLQEDQLSMLARTDGLTGLANRRAFDEALEREWKRTLRDASPLSLFLLDIDHFKEFNDAYGHQVGDDCLRTVAMTVRDAVCRSMDIVARYGGEEIGVILPSTAAKGAFGIAEAMRHSIEALGFSHVKNVKGNGVVTASIGVATAFARHGGSMTMPESLLMSADHALYKAKRDGRNRVATTLLIASQDLTRRDRPSE